MILVSIAGKKVCRKKNYERAFKTMMRSVKEMVKSVETVETHLNKKLHKRRN